jgi:kynurenine formamidase
MATTSSRALLRAFAALSLFVATAADADADPTCGASSPPPSSSSPSHVDITAPVDASLVTWEKADGLGASHRVQSSSRADGDDANVSELAFGAHTGTHVDAPRHFARDSDAGIETLHLSWMNGPAMVIDAFDVPALTAEALASLDIPRGVERVVFRTDNTRRRLMRLRAFQRDYVAFTEDGARWMVDFRPDVKTIGVDYVSVAAYDHLVAAHRVLLEAGKVPLEGLVIPEESVRSGWWRLHCAPLLLVGSDGAPARAWLTELD